MISEYEEFLEVWARDPRHIDMAFIYDGIIDPSQWAMAPRKVLILLKEAYAFDDETKQNGFDLRQLLRDKWGQPKYKMWWTAALWCYVVHATSSKTPAFPSGSDKAPLLSKALLSSAVVNIKKSNGKAFSEDHDLIGYVKKDRELLRKQIEWINPDVIICGGTWRLVHQELWPDAEEIFDRVWMAGSNILIDFGHPANQFPDHLQYYALSGILLNSGILSRPTT